MILDVGDRPPLLQWLFLSFQHVFAMFGANDPGAYTDGLTRFGGTFSQAVWER